MLQNRLDKMIVHVEQHNLALQQFQALQTMLFTLDSLPELIDAVLEQAKLFFKQDISSLALLNEDAKITGYLADKNYNYQQNQSLLLLGNKTSINNELTQAVFTGRYDHARHSVFFPKLEKKDSDVIIIPLTRRGKYLGSLNLAAATTLNKVKVDFLPQLGFAVSICLENQLNFAIAQQASRSEALANANNRRFMEQRLVEELERGQRSTHSLTCVMLDIAFPVLKDQQEAMQLEIQILKTVAETAKRQLRVSDVFSYYDGKKFTAFLTNLPESIVMAITKRLKTSITEQIIKFAGQIVPLTISIGYANYQLDNTQPKAKTNSQIALELIAAADENLNNAKLKAQPLKK